MLWRCNPNEKRKIFVPLFSLFITSPVSISATTATKRLSLPKVVSPTPSLTYFIFRSNVVGSIVCHSALSRLYTIKCVLHLPQTLYICKAIVMDSVVLSPTESNTPPSSKVQETIPTLVELSHDIIDAMTVKEMRFAMKRLRKSLISSTKHVRKLFETPSRSHPTIISAYSSPKMNCIHGNVLQTDRTSYHGTF